MTVSLLTYSQNFIGLSTDTKPIGVSIGCTFYEYNTRRKYMTYDGTNWIIADTVTVPELTVDFDFVDTGITDQVSGNDSTTTRAGSITGTDSDGTYKTSGVDTAWIDSVKGLRVGTPVVDNLFTSPLDISGWSKVGSPTISGTDGFTATAQYNAIQESIATVEGVLYTLSFVASVESGGQTAMWFRHFYSEDGNDTEFVLSETPTLKTVTVLGKVGDGSISFGVQDRNSSNWAKITITNFQVAPSAYKLPDNFSGSPTVTQLNTETINDLAGEFPKLFDSLDGVADGTVILDDDFSTDTSADYSAGSGTISYNSTDKTLRCTSTITSVYGFLPTIGVVAGTYYDIIFIARGNRNADIRAIGDNVTPVTPYELKNPVITTAWQEYHFRFLPTGTTFRIYQNGGGSIGDYFEIDNLITTKITPAQGQAVLKINTMWDASDVSGEINIISLDGTVSHLRYDATNTQLELFDGTNLASVGLTISADTTYRIYQNYNGTLALMQIGYSIFTGDTESEITWGTQATFDGSFGPGTDGTLALDAEEPFFLGEIFYEKQSGPFK